MTPGTCPCGSGETARFLVIEGQRTVGPDMDRACPKCIGQVVLDHVPFLPKGELRIRFDNSDGAYVEATGAVSA